jgi:phosphoserine phosphatase
MKTWFLSVLLLLYQAISFAHTPLIEHLDLTDIVIPPAYIPVLERVRVLKSDGKVPVVALDVDGTLFSTDVSYLTLDIISRIQQGNQTGRVISMERSARVFAEFRKLIMQGWVQPDSTLNLELMSRDILSKGDPNNIMQELMARRVAFSMATLFFNKMNPASLNQIIDQALLPEALRTIYVEQLKFIQEVQRHGGVVILVSATADPIIKRISQWLFGGQVLNVGMPIDVQLPLVKSTFPATVSAGKLWWLATTLDAQLPIDSGERVVVATVGDNIYTDRAFLTHKPEAEGMRTVIDRIFEVSRVSFDALPRSFLITNDPNVHKTMFLLRNPGIQPLHLTPLSATHQLTKLSIDVLVDELPKQHMAPITRKETWLERIIRECRPN